MYFGKFPKIERVLAEKTSGFFQLDGRVLRGVLSKRAENFPKCYFENKLSQRFVAGVN